MTLESHSSLKRYWDLLAGLRGAGFALTTPKRSTPESCRRAVEGLRFAQAGGLLDVDAIRVALLNDDGPWELGQFTLSELAASSVSSLLAGEATQLRAILDAAYELHVDLIVAFTRARELIAKVSNRYRPLNELSSPFPPDFPLQARRFGDINLRTLLDRAATGAYSPRSTRDSNE